MSSVVTAVAEGHTGPADQQLADHPRRHLAALAVDHPRVGVVDRPADRHLPTACARRLVSTNAVASAATSVEP